MRSFFFFNVGKRTKRSRPRLATPSTIFGSHLKHIAKDSCGLSINFFKLLLVCFHFPHIQASRQIFDFLQETSTSCKKYDVFISLRKILEKVINPLTAKPLAQNRFFTGVNCNFEMRLLAINSS